MVFSLDEHVYQHDQCNGSDSHYCEKFPQFSFVFQGLARFRYEFVLGCHNALIMNYEGCIK